MNKMIDKRMKAVVKSDILDSVADLIDFLFVTNIVEDEYVSAKVEIKGIGTFDIDIDFEAEGEEEEGEEYDY